MLIHRVSLVFLFAIGCATFYGCFISAVAGYVKLKDDPAWLKALTNVIGLVIYLAGPGLMFYSTRRWQMNFIRSFAARLARIEAILDRDRASTGLTPEGTSPKIGPEP